MKGKQNPTEGVDYQQLQQAQKLWMQGLDEPFMNIIESQKQGKERFYAVGAKAFTERGRQRWSLADLEFAKQYALQCLAEDYHFRILLRNENGLLTLKAVQALDMHNASLVQCTKWLTVSWALQLHHKQLFSASRDVELLNAIADWLVSIPELEGDPWVDYGHILSELLDSNPDWSWVRQEWDSIIEMDKLVKFERIILERVVSPDDFCMLDISEYTWLSSAQRERWTDASYQCFK